MSLDRVYTWEEIRRHNTDKDCWVVLYDNVLDVTEFLNLHPGGLDPINDQGGYDITNSFESIGHSDNALEKSKKYIIGKLDKASKPPAVKRKEVPNQVSMEDLRNFKMSDDPFAGVKRIAGVVLVILLAIFCAFFYNGSA
mmetsp:Transcript_36859/g.43045  ORF Transcript_36859/g.43045 Transcript_36859/m.43045 type:complete len:140 (-) Transcript_36859:97-516(-)